MRWQAQLNNRLMDTLLEDLQDYLEDNGIGTTSTDLFIGKLEGEPDDQIALFSTGGLAPDVDVPIAKPTVQVLVRNTDYATGWQKAQDIFNLLHQQYDTLEMGDTDVMKIDALQEPTPLGKDTNERHVFTCNYIFWVRR